MVVSEQSTMFQPIIEINDIIDTTIYHGGIKCSNPREHLIPRGKAGLQIPLS